MANLLGWLGKKAHAVEAQINPFDNGQTYKTVVNNQRSAPPVYHGPSFFQRYSPGNIIGGAAQGLVHTGQQANRQAEGIVQGTLKIPIEALATAKETITHQPTTIHLTPRESILTGTPNVQSIQQIARSNYRGAVQGKHPNLALPGTAALVAGHLAQDYPLFRAGAKGISAADQALSKALPATKELSAAKVGLSTKSVNKTVKKYKPLSDLPSKPVGPSPKVNPTDVAIRSTTGVLNKIDPRLGAMVTRRRELAEVGAAKAKNDLKITNTLNKSEQINLARVLKGTENSLNDKVLAASQETRKVLNQAYYKAKGVGVPVKKYRSNYFPQILNPKSFKEGTKQFDAQIQHLITTKQAKNEADAIGLLRKYKNTRTVSPYGNLAESRSLDLQGYAENRAALHQYLDRAYATIAHHKVMGPEDKFLNKVLADVRQNGGDVEQAIKSYRQASGLARGSERGERISRVLTNTQGATKLGLSSILNATQPANTAIVTGIGRTAKTYAKALAKRDREFLNRSGVADEQVAHEALFSEQGVTKGLRKVTAPLFEAVEKQNRRSAGLAGKDLANALAKRALKGDTKAANRLKTEFGIDKVGKSGLTEAQQIKAARNIVERSQFRTGNQDLPGWTSTPLGKVGSQFRRYPLKQAQFLGREVLKPLARGNVLPAARLAAVGVPVGLGAHEIQDKLRGGSFQNTPAETALQTFNNATGGDLLTSLARSLIPGSSVDANAYISKVIKSLGGPTVSDVAKGTQAGFEASKGKPTNAERFGLTHVPVVGTPISNRVLPYNDQNQKTATKSENQDIKSLRAKPPKGFSLQQTSDGKYAYTIPGDKTVHTSSKLKDAQNAVGRAQFAQEGMSYKVVGNTVYRKSASGTVTTQPKIQFDYQVNGATLTAQKNAGDINGWLSTAKTQLDNISKQLKDPSIDPLEALKLQNSATSLQKNIDKYTGYGGFKKPKSTRTARSTRGSRGGSKGSSSKSATYKVTKTASASSIPKPKGIKVKKLTAPNFKSSKTKKIAVSKIRSNYTNRKLS